MGLERTEQSHACVLCSVSVWSKWKALSMGRNSPETVVKVKDSCTLL